MSTAAGAPRTAQSRQPGSQARWPGAVPAPMRTDGRSAGRRPPGSWPRPSQGPRPRAGEAVDTGQSGASAHSTCDNRDTMAPEELSPSQAARRIGTTTRSVQRWIANGSLPGRRVGGRWRVASDALDAFMARGAPGEAPGEVTAEPIIRRIQHIFVANRGEIARRISRTCERLGIRVTVPVTVGPDPLDLLDITAVVSAARAAGADALHPGFGFLAENAAFAEAVENAGLQWIGPPPAAIHAMGDKATARRLAQSLGVPVVPGYDGADQSDAALTAAAAAIAYPILVKPAAGGGGKGIRIVRDAAALRDALGSSRREAAVAFGDARVILERFVEAPRHGEVPGLFDEHWQGVHLGERDCSLPRPHPKV